MLRPDQRTTVLEERRREAGWRAATREAENRTLSQYAEMAHVLRLEPGIRRAWMSAALEAARQYHESCMYASYERRTGHPYPPEAHEHDQAVNEQVWAGELARLRACVAAASDR